MLRCSHTRLDQRKSLLTLAKQTGLTKPVLNLVEQGRLVPTEDEAARIGKALGIPPQYLLVEITFDEQPTAPTVEARV